MDHKAWTRVGEYESNCAADISGLKQNSVYQFRVRTVGLKHGLASTWCVHDEGIALGRKISEYLFNTLLRESAEKSVQCLA